MWLRHLSFIRLLILLLVCVMFIPTTQPQDTDTGILLFEGTVVDDLGQPLKGALVQFWHTDPNGNYKHPNFVTISAPLLDDFQYFGTSTTNSDGQFNFVTYRPGIYSQRPITHIHYKVWYMGQDILTSQFYFRDEQHTQFNDLLQLDLSPYDTTDVNNNNNNNNNETTATIIMTMTNKTIYVNLGLGGQGPFTPFQTAGPFYPAVDFFDFDSDLTKVTEEEITDGSGAYTAQSTTSLINTIVMGWMFFLGCTIFGF